MVKHSITFAVLVLIGGIAAAAPPQGSRIVGVWRAGAGGGQQIPFEGTAAQIQQKRAQLGKGYGVSSIAAFPGISQHYVVVFEPMPEGATAKLLFDLTPQQFQTTGKTLFDSGYRLVDVALSADAKNPKLVRYSGYWRKGLGTGSQFAILATSWANFAAQGQKHFSAGRRLVSMSNTIIGDQVVFTGVWNSGQGNGAMFAIPPTNGSEYVKKAEQYKSAGLRTVAHSVYTLTNGQTVLYTGIVGTNVPAGEEFINDPKDSPWSAFMAQHAKKVAQGFRLADVSLLDLDAIE